MPINRQHALRGAHLIIGSALVGLGLNTALFQPAWGNSILSRRDLLAQQVVDGLPPPPSFPPADLSNFPAPPPSTPAAPATPGTAVVEELYMVFVNGNSPLLLEQVRQVQPDALIQEYQGQPIILVGAYDDLSLADEQINALAENGISAVMSPVPSRIFEPAPLANDGFAGVPELPPADFDASPAQVPVAPPQQVAVQPPPREIEFAPVPGAVPSVTQPYTPPTVTANSQPLADDAYYIVIPGSSEELSQMRDQVIMLGGRHDVVAQRERPLGPHVLVGPFVNRQAASRWNSFLRDFGLNARVYYRR